ncbi:hypothetical protein PIB30_055441, partial [Stylosanthes scabra]|nr:hypothetical protein [Stylosanthes scabra]
APETTERFHYYALGQESYASYKVSTVAVFRDSEGKLLTTATVNKMFSSALVAEASAMRQALIMADNLKMEKILFESNNQTLMQALKSKTQVAEIEVFLEDIWELCNRLPELGFTWVPREANRLAHEFAKSAAGIPLVASWSTNLPFSIKSLIRLEAILENRRG